MRAPLLLAAALCLAVPTAAAPFSISITNTAPAGTPGWSTGLLTLQPLIGLGRSPTLAADAGAWATYQYANSHCETTPGCTPSGCENGNAALLAQRWGLTLGVNAWLVPALAVNATAVVTLDAPVGSRLSYLAWVNDTSVFDDFVALHPPGTDFATLSTLSVPLFSGSTPLENVDFVISGYDVNSTSATDGSGATCTPECPATGASCFVAPGNATYGATGALGTPPTQRARNVTAVSGSGQVRLAWSNVAPHTGVIIARRANTAVTWTPTNGTTYTLNQQVANQGGNPTTIVYAETNSAATAFTNTTGLTNGTRYFYKVFAFANGRTYATGDVPGTQGIWAEPTTKTGQSPLWCYSVGFPTVQQPTTELGTRVFTASNGGTLTASLTQPGVSDGFEAWRPLQLDGGVQNRPLLVPIQSGANHLITGDQSGRAYLVRASDGALLWTSSDLGEIIQGQPVAQLAQYANAAFTTAHPGRDVIFVATRNNSTTTNKVYAVSSTNGAVLWTYPATNSMDMVSGGMAVDYTNNRLWIATRSNPSLRVVSTLNGAQAATFNLGAIDNGVNLRTGGGFAEAITITNAGTVYGFDLATLTQRWSRAIGVAPTAWAFPLGSGFIAPLTNSVRRYDVLPDAGTVLVWSANVPGAGGVVVDFRAGQQYVYVGGSSSRLRQLDINDGGTVRSLTMPGTATTFGHPALDTSANRLHVGTLDGRLCAFPVPLP